MTPEEKWGWSSTTFSDVVCLLGNCHSYGFMASAACTSSALCLAATNSFMCLSPCSLPLNLWKMCRSNIYTLLFYKQRWFEAFSIFSINISYKLVLKRIIYIAGGENFHVKAQQAIGLLVQVIHKKPCFLQAIVKPIQESNLQFCYISLSDTSFPANSPCKS